MSPKVPLLCVPLLAAACAHRRSEPPVYLNRDVHSVVVLPSFNETVTVDAWKTAWPHLIDGVARRGYRVVSKEDVEAFYRKNNFHAIPEEVNLYTVQELATEFKTDAVLYSNIVKWGYKYVGIYSEYGVTIELRLVDGRSGEPIWKGEAAAHRSQGLEGNNAGGLIVSLFAVAGNAFLRSSDTWAEECIGTGIRKLPLPGYAPGTNPPPAPSIEGSPPKPPEENP
jgi:hypothetical protein